MSWLLVLGISLANNLDNTGVGIAYGIARIRLPQLVNLWIAVITFAITASSVAFGSGISRYLAPEIAKYIGATILCVIGLTVLAPILKRSKSRRDAAANPVRRILEDPMTADRDDSRHIDYKEGSLLGIALSINNIGGGLSAGLVHLSVFWTALLSAILSFLVLWLGGIAGRRVATGRLADYATILSGVLLISIGLYQLR
jgi:putative sporulation protein YtaF